MIRKLSLPMLLVAVLGATLVAAEPPWATLVLRSGDRISGQLADLGGVDYTMFIRGEERRIPKNDVALIDFMGDPAPPSEVAKMRPGQHLVVFRNGDIFYGHILDINGTEPRRITFDTPDGQREVVANDIARIYLARWEGMPEAGSWTGSVVRPELAQGGSGTPVPARPCWTNMGISVARGQSVTFAGSGEIQLSEDPQDIATVAGSKTGRHAVAAPIPSSLAGALIGRVGNSLPFGIGNQTVPLSMPAAGELYLGINDDECNDNWGEFKVVISVQAVRRR